MYIGKIKNTLQDWFIPTYLLGFGCVRTYYYARNSFGNISKGFINEVYADIFHIPESATRGIVTLREYRSWVARPQM
jgi:hypothetical protein